MATMNPKVSIKAQSPEKVPYMAPSHSGVAAGALSAAGMSSRVSRRVDVSPEHLQPLPDDVEVRLEMTEPAYSRDWFQHFRLLLLLARPTRLPEIQVPEIV